MRMYFASTIEIWEFHQGGFHGTVQIDSFWEHYLLPLQVT